MNIGYIYIIKNNINSKVYIGSTKNNIQIRWYQHRNYLKTNYRNKLYTAFLELSIENFYIELLEKIEYTTISELRKSENNYINLFDSIKTGYNSKNSYIKDNEHIINNNILEKIDICRIINNLAGNRFISIIENNKHKLYCNNGKFWINDDIILRNFISNELYDFLNNHIDKLNIIYDNIQLNKFKNYTYVTSIVNTYKEFDLCDNITFDNKWWLLGFKNCVYDLKEYRFREYEYEDYVSITCGYDWKEPTEDELKIVNNLIEQIMPIDKKRNLYLQILSTTIDGRCFDKILIFNEENSILNNFIANSLGQYSIIKYSLKNKFEKSILSKKRLAILKNSFEIYKFKNFIVEEIIGIDNHLTLIFESNCDIICKNNFKNINLFNQNIIFEDISYLKSNEFQEKYRYALIKILINEHYKNYNNIKNLKIIF
jgi:hypothetical protein